MKNFILAVVCVTALSSSALAKTINVPAQTLEHVVTIARKHLEARKLDLSHYFLAFVEYRNLHNEYEKPYWQVEWRMLAGTNARQIVVVVKPDGSASHTTTEER